jgi:hypothetical protein
VSGLRKPLQSIRHKAAAIANEMCKNDSSELKCGTRKTWSILTFLGFVLAIVGVVVFVGAQGAVCDGDWKPNHMYPATEGSQMLLGCTERTFPIIPSPKEADPNLCGKCYTEDIKDSEAVRIMKECCKSTCTCKEVSGRHLIGIILMVIGAVAGSVFSCGICKQCCFGQPASAAVAAPVVELALASSQAKASPV